MAINTKQFIELVNTLLLAGTANNELLRAMAPELKDKELYDAASVVDNYLFTTYKGLREIVESLIEAESDTETIH